MKKCLLILFGLFWGTLSFLLAENVSVDKALQIASHFAQRIPEQQFRSNQPLQLAYTAQPALRSGAPEAYYYVFNSGKGFIIVSGDDRAYPILGYSTSGNFSYEEAPDNMKWWLQEYANQIQFAYTNGIEQDTEVKQQWQELQAGTGLRSLRSQVKLETALWEQNSPFNDQCPWVNNKRSVTGCVATAMAIIMKYHQHPQQGTGSYSYTDDYGHTYSANFATTYDWGSMLDVYTSNYTNIQGQAVATLMYHCGVSCDMNYDPNGSGAVLGKVAIALPKYFDYDKGACGMVRDGHPADEWASIIQEELNKNRPVAYGGQSGKSGHAFVLAGYNNSNQYYVNWGWGKKYDGTDYNGWFPLSALTLAGSTYSYQQDMVLRIQKPAGGQPLYRFVIANNQPGVSKGMVLGSTPLQPSNFTVKVSSLAVESSGPFRAEGKIAHISASGQIKSIVSSSIIGLNTQSPGGTYGEIVWRNCKITEKIESGDQLCMVYSIDSGPYIIVDGTSELPTRINLTDGGSTTTFGVTWNTLTGVTVSPLSGYNAQSIDKGGTFKFKITNNTGKNVVVKNGTTILTPDASGVYTLSNIQSNIQLTITLADTTYKVTWNTLTGITVSPLSGYNAQSIAKGGTFKFKITNSTVRNVVVKNGTTLLTPDASGIYTLSNIQSNIQLTITLADTTYKVTWNTLTGVTVSPLSGYNAQSIAKGGTFKFKITNSTVRNVVVKNGTTILTPDASGIYTLSNIQSDIQLTITLEALPTTFTVTLPIVTGFDIKAISGYDPTSVAKGADFKFTVVPKTGYEQYTVKVTSNNVLLTPGAGNIYTIPNVQTNQIVKVEATSPNPGKTYQINWSGDNGATLIPETGYNANSIEEGDDFKFRVTVDPDYQGWILTVSVNGLIISPDIKGVYRIANIRSNKTLVITLTEVFTVTYVKPKEDVKMVVENGYDPAKVIVGSDFQFRLVSKYSLNNLTVMANGVTLHPTNAIYTIRNIREDIQVTVVVDPDVSIEEVSSDQVKIVVKGYKLCITHPNLKNVPVYVTSFGGNLVKADVLNGVYTELDLSVGGAYIVSFKDFSKKVLVR